MPERDYCGAEVIFLRARGLETALFLCPSMARKVLKNRPANVTMVGHTFARSRTKPEEEYGMDFEGILKTVLPYGICAIIAFFVLPAISLLFPQEQQLQFLLIMLSVVNTAFTFISCAVFVIHRGFHWYYPVLVILLFALSFMCFYTAEVSIYLFSNIFLAVGGTGMGMVIQKLIERNR